MKLTRIFLGCMAIALVSSAFADDNDNQHKFGEKRVESKPQVNAITVTQPAVATSHGFNTMRFNQPPVNVQRQNVPQSNNQPHFQNPQIQNPQVNVPRSNNPVAPDHFHGTNQPTDPKWVGHDTGQQRFDNHSFGNHGADNRGFDNHADFNNHGPHFTPGWTNHYRMPYRQGNSGGYSVHYTRSWPSNYGWRVHGWREDYQTVDPYWFALITSMAVAQSWSDEELAQAINDDNLRQQMIYDADVRQQMINSGYPAAQVDYPPTDDSVDASGYPPSDQGDQGVPPDYNGQEQYSQGQYSQDPNQYNQAPSPDQGGYYPPPNQPAPMSISPNSPLYNSGQDAGMPSGEQIANQNANKNALFFCTTGNKQQAAQAFSQIQSPDMTVWTTMDSFNRCASWATP